MANDTPRIIQKDLGLVTAYGYALAGGYEGTEQQFIEDFAKLMQGRMHNDYTFATIAEMNAAIQAGQIEDGATIYCKEEKGTINNEVRQEDVSDLFEEYRRLDPIHNTTSVYETDCGNNTFVTLKVKFTNDWVLKQTTTETFLIAEGLDYELYNHLLACKQYGTNRFLTEMIGFNSHYYEGWNNLGKELRKNPKILPSYAWSVKNDGSVTAEYNLMNVGDDPITIKNGTQIVIDHFFINMKSVALDQS